VWKHWTLREPMLSAGGGQELKQQISSLTESRMDSAEDQLPR
jgi:hypothetical protein